MSSPLESYLDQIITIITCDGRNIVGILRGFDQSINLIVEQCVERIFSLDSPMKCVELGLYVIRGENIALVGEMSEEAFQHPAILQSRAPQLKPVVH